MDQNTENLSQEKPVEPVQNELFVLPEEQKTTEPASQEQQQNAAASVPTESEPQSDIPLIHSEISAAEPAQPEVAVVPRPQIRLHGGNGATLGELLKEARSAAGFSLDDVADRTHIRAEYIKGLELNEHDKLPTPVFLRGYIKILSDLYQLDAASRDMVFEHLQELEPVKDVPEKLLENIEKDGQVSQEEAKRVRLFLIYGGIILLLLLSFTATCVIALSVRSSRIKEQQKQVLKLQPFETSKLETLLPPQMADPVMLEVPEGKK